MRGYRIRSEFGGSRLRRGSFHDNPRTTEWTSQPHDVGRCQGHLRFSRTKSGRDGGGRRSYYYERTTLSGEDPVALQDPSHRASLREEIVAPHPDRRSNAYPHAFDHLAQLFDHSSAPDLVVLHSAAHYWGDQGGHLGEHGSLGVVQARAPFIAAGAGVQSLGMVEASCRLVDVAPTILELLGCPAPAGLAPSARLIRQDGEIVSDIVAQPGGARHVVAFLLDATNPNVRYDLAARDQAPTIARLMELGTTFGHGAIASLPTVTLANHTTNPFGLPSRPPRDLAQRLDRPGNGQSGRDELAVDLVDVDVLAQLRRRDGAQRRAPGDSGVDDDLDQRALRCRSRLLHLRPDAEGRAHRPSTMPGGASGRDRAFRPAEQGLPLVLAHRPHHRRAVLRHLGRSVSREGLAGARVRWVNFTLTDAAFHEGGPYSEIAAASVRDTDARIGRLLEAVERAEVFDQTAFVLVADHGMQLADPKVTGDWGVALAEARLAVRDEGYGFLYLTSR
jgi:phosphonoacetate hydrolase